MKRFAVTLVFAFAVLTITASAQDNKIPAGSKVYIEPMGGFESYMAAALQQKNVPLVVVADKDKADFVIKGMAEEKKAGWAKIVFQGNTSPTGDASIQIVNVKSGVIAFAVSEHRRNSLHGQRSVAEYLAKKIGQKMKDDEKPQKK
ncbi:MAG TPA: hypothetical protein VFD58_32065 [Blastocatellia bacterium]|nr:hypothetical protein [Blastocatellia bacterium]